MPDRFVPLAAFVRPPATADPIEPPPRVACGDAGRDAGSEGAAELAETIGDIRRFRAALADALDAAVETLLLDIAAGVLARELRLAPCDLAAIVTRALERFGESEPLLIRVHPQELAAIGGCGAPVVADEGLRRGDACIDLRSGTIDATLGARLVALLECPVRA